ncbi:MAG: glycosyltransferase 2 family protein [Pseudonocardiales bacterium]|nr:glycosyltransferase 2 family protein [Pseudonocardiales bacterium]
MHPPDPTPPARLSRRHPSLSGAVRIGGILVAIAAVALCVKTIAGQWPSIRTAIAHANPGWLSAALVCSAASMTGLGLLWWRCLHLFGSPVRSDAAIAWYFGGELGKYLPGGVWTVLGRGELAQRGGGVSRSTGYATTLISYGAMCIGAASVCGVLAPFVAADGRHVGWTWIMVLLVPLGVAAVHPAVFGRVLALGRRVTRGRLDLSPPTWSSMLRLIAWSIPTWLLLGGAAVLVTEALGYHQHPARVAFAAIAAWIIGFLAVPVPAGAGLRELVFVAVCGLPAAPAVAVAAIARALFLLVDGVGGVVGLWYTQRTIPRVGPPTAGEGATAYPISATGGADEQG